MPTVVLYRVVYLELSVFGLSRQKLSLLFCAFQTLKQNTEVRGEGSDGSAKREISTQTPLPQTVSYQPHSVHNLQSSKT